MPPSHTGLNFLPFGSALESRCRFIGPATYGRVGSTLETRSFASNTDRGAIPLQAAFFMFQGLPAFSFPTGTQFGRCPACAAASSERTSAKSLRRGLPLASSFPRSISTTVLEMSLPGRTPRAARTAQPGCTTGGLTLLARISRSIEVFSACRRPEDWRAASRARSATEISSRACSSSD